MAVNYTTLLGLAKPVSGTSAGTWGDDLNDGVTSLVDSAIAGTTTLTASTVLSTTQGGANEARQAILVVSSAATGAVVITAPAQSKVYLVANDSAYTATLKASATTGVDIEAGQYALVMWNSGLSPADFVVVASTSNATTVNSFSAGTTGFTPSSTSSGAITLAGTLNVANGGTGVTTLTGIVKGDGTNDFSAASGTDVTTLIGTNPVTRATNIAGGTASQIPYQTGANTTSFITAPTTNNYLKWDGSAYIWDAPSNPVGVSSFSAGTTGLTPSTTTTGAVTLAGTLGVGNGGTGLTTLTGIAYGNGTSAFTAATGSQIATAIGSNAVTKATNVAGGAASKIVYQSAADTSAFIDAPTATGQYLNWNGSAFAWSVVAKATNVAGGAANKIVYQSGADTSAFVDAPVTTDTYLKWNGTAFTWATVSAGSGTVTSTSVVSANGFGGSVATATTTPAITLTTSITGILKGSSSALAAATGTDVTTLIDTNPVTRATNIAGGGANQLHYQTAANTTSFVSAPVSASTFLQWNGTAFAWSTVATATNIAGGAANQLAYQTGSGTTSFVTAPVSASTFLQWNGSAFAWAAGNSGTVTSASVTTANGFGGSVATSTTTPAITITTSVNGIAKGNGTALSTAVDGTDYVSPSGGATLTNKRIDPRVSSTASASSVTPTIASYDQYCFTALAAGLTINAPTGTPVDGDKLLFRILDNGTSRTLTWNATYTAIGVTLPTATTASKTTYVGCVYNANNARWDVIAVTTQV